MPVSPFRLLFPLVAALACLLANVARANPVYLTDARLATLKQRVANKTEPNFSAWLMLLKEADAALAFQPVVPAKLHTLSPYKFSQQERDALAKTSTLSRDTHAVFRLAVAYRITGEERYAAAAVRILNAWESGIKGIDAKNSNTSLTISSSMPCFIIAADLLKSSPQFSQADQERFKRFLRERIIGSQSAELCMKRTNNWANFGTLLALCEGAYLDDQKIFQRGLERWKQLINSQMSPDGTLREEVNRIGHDHAPGEMGLWYSNFSLLPATFGAEVARVNGVELYDYTSPKGNSLRKAYLKLIPWLKNPASFSYYKGNKDPNTLVGIHHFPYFELLTARWPEPDALALLHQHRPQRTNHCIPDTTFTHGDLLKD